MSQTPNSKLAELFYEKETEFYGIPPFALLDEVGEAVVNGVLGMIEKSPEAMSRQIDFLSPAQIESVSSSLFLCCLIVRDWGNGLI